MTNAVFEKRTFVVPMLRSELTCTLTLPWYVDCSEYKPKPATFKLLVNGQEAFREVYRAIEGAKKSVSIICWGFQPSMYFIRGEPSLMIGELLEQKAREGVKVRVLCWAFDALGEINVTGYSKGLGESNTPGRWANRMGDRPPFSSNTQYEYDQKFYYLYDRKQQVPNLYAQQRWGKIKHQAPTNNLIFTSRSYTEADREKLKAIEFEDKNISFEMRLALIYLPSHHQKMVTVDHEDPDHAWGFVMGHNMLDQYWDTPEHSGQRQLASWGRNGAVPFHDYSSRVTGPIIGDLFHNFAHAWKRETGEQLLIPPFGKYPVRPVTDAKAVCQILRTQPQYDCIDIQKCYLQTVINAVQYIHIENQYFRWPPLAQQITKWAQELGKWKRTPQQHGPLYLFVITNSSEAGMGKGTFKTSEMMDALGRADRIPEVTRQIRLQEIDEQLLQNQKAQTELMNQRKQVNEQYRQGMAKGSNPERIVQEWQASIDKNLEPLKAQEKALLAKREKIRPQSDKERKAGSDRRPEEIVPRDIPGLKVHIATLVAPDTPKGQPWQEVYIHAKMMMIDDTFMTLGSANINTRSMQTDTELNITHHRPEITKPIREQQWARYTNGIVRPGMSLKKVYDQWGKLMKENAENKAQHLTPIAQLCEFLHLGSVVSNTD